MIVRGRLYSLMPRGRLAQVLMAVAALLLVFGATLGIVRPGDADRPPGSIPLVRNAGGRPPIADLTPYPTAAPEPTPSTAPFDEPSDPPSTDPLEKASACWQDVLRRLSAGARPGQWQSTQVSYDGDGRLRYAVDAGRNRIPDFSFAGYRYGHGTCRRCRWSPR